MPEDDHSCCNAFKKPLGLCKRKTTMLRLEGVALRMADHQHAKMPIALWLTLPLQADAKK